MIRLNRRTVLTLVLAMLAFVLMLLAGIMLHRIWTQRPAMVAATVRRVLVDPPASLPDSTASTQSDQTERLMQRLDQESQKLRDMSPQSIAQTVKTIEATVGYGQINRKMTPDPQAAGPFDPQTASLYDIIKLISPDGTIRYRFDYVDASGRVLTAIREPESLTNEDRTAFNIFERARQNPNLRPLVDSVRKWAEHPSMQALSNISMTPTSQPASASQPLNP